MKIDQQTWDFFQEALGYNKEEMAKFKAHPGTETIIARAGVVGRTSFTAEVVEAHGCFSGHKVGDRLVLDGAGNLLTHKCPEKMCVYLMNSLGTLVFGAQERLFAGADPNRLVFSRCSCLDVGVSCGGWGRVVLELKAETRPE